MTHIDLDGWFDYEALYDYVVQRVPDGGTIVEVGCWMGRSLAYLARKVKDSGKRIKVVAVDTGFGSIGGSDYPLHQVQVDQCGGNFAGRLVKNLADCDVLDVCWPLIVPSVRAAQFFADESIDFVFIDGDHAEQAVRDDLTAWYPKIKRGGLFAGHDYNSWDTVTRAVNGFFGGEYPTPLSRHCWFVRKLANGSWPPTKPEMSMPLLRQSSPRAPYVDKIVIGVQAFNRPDLLWRCLRSLQLAADRAPGLQVETVGLVDRLPDGSVNAFVLDMFEKKWEGLLPIDHIIVTDRNLDANDACLVLTNECFNRGDFVIHSEDDILYSYDYLDFMASAFQRYRDVPAVLTVEGISGFGNSKTYHEVAPHLYATCAYPSGIQLYGGGWFRRTWEKFRPVWTPSGPVALDTGLTAAIPEHERYCVRPVVSRAMHVGFYQGRYSGAPCHSAEQYDQYEAGHYLRWTSDSFHPKCVTEFPWKWVNPPGYVYLP